MLERAQNKLLPCESQICRKNDRELLEVTSLIDKAVNHHRIGRCVVGIQIRTNDVVRPRRLEPGNVPGLRSLGSLTVAGRTRPLSFDAQVSGSDGSEVTLDGEVQVNRTDFGFTWNQMGMASVHNTITVHAVFIRK